MTILFDPSVYVRLSPEARLHALGLMPTRQEPFRSFKELGPALGGHVDLVAQMDTSRESDVLDIEAQSRDRFWQGPFSTTEVGRRVLGKWLPPLAAYLAGTKPPKGLDLRGLSEEQLSFLVLRALLNRIYDQWGLGPDRDAKRKRKKRRMLRSDRRRAFCIELGGMVRDELEFAGLFIAKKWIAALGKPSKTKTPRQANRAKRAALGKFRRVDWMDAEKVRVGDWLIKATEVMDCFTLDADDLPTIAPAHRAAIDDLAEELIFKHPLYRPLDAEPPAWDGWRIKYKDRISATFVGTAYAETAKEMEAAFADGSIKEHAAGVSAIQRVPLKINPPMLELLRKYGGEEYRRDVAIAEALGSGQFWLPIRCDFRGRLVHLCGFNYTRGDPVRSLFIFARGKPIGSAINWLEIAVANAFGAKGTSPARHEWVAENQTLIKAVATDPGRIWEVNIKAKEPFAFAAACIEYVAADHCGAEYPTHLPVWLDASSNGLQHLAMIRRDKELAV